MGQSQHQTSSVIPNMNKSVLSKVALRIKVAQITDNLEQSFDMGQVTGAVFLDLTAPYDTGWLIGLRLID